MTFKTKQKWIAVYNRMENEMLGYKVRITVEDAVVKNLLRET